ncbi:MAG: DUF362 domain-containing protein [Myxococcota bacterium]|nr:DUF362 domain-containing protein [Myxococcota bacterium]
MTARVGLARTKPSYAGLSAPFGPGAAYPELAAFGDHRSPGSDDDAPNHVYAAVRAALAGAGLDEERFGSADWDPLGSLVGPGARIVLKPNFIRHWNPCAEGTLASLITHGAVLRAMADYAWLAAGDGGSVVIAEAPQHDCDWDVVAANAGLDDLVRFYDERIARRLEVIDLRREVVRYADGVIVQRRSLPGDPAGYRLVDLGERSAFHGSGLDPKRFRGADYDAQPTTEHHTGGRHEYLLSETVLSSDLVVNLPKLKTHKKTGVTLALKNLVGINGDKNLLPHHCVGSAGAGGDEFPGEGRLDRVRSAATEVARGLLRRRVGTRLVRWVRRAENAARASDFVRSGNWYGNRTTWRMCLDLNRALYYSDRSGTHFGAAAPVRTVLTVIDGVVAGEGEGPLAPTDRPLGVVLASLDPIALDLAAVRLMGFDETRIPKVWETLRTSTLRVSSVRDAADVVVHEIPFGDARSRVFGLEGLAEEPCFVAHPGWRGHLERRVRALAEEAVPCAG